jgi:ADP-heptose:LPS heptosyltransferase
VHLNFIRWVDKTFSSIIVRFLYLIWLAVGHRQLETPPSFAAVKKVLIIKFFGSGSILLASPAIYKIKECHPNAEVSIFTLSENKETCSLLSAIDNIYYLDLKRFFPFLFNYLKIIREIRNKHYDVVLDLEFITNFSALTTLLVSFSSKPPATIGFSSHFIWRNKVYSMAIPFDHSRHITEIFKKLFSPLTNKFFEVDFKDSKKDLISTARQSPLTTNLLESNSDRNKIVCVNINAGKLCHLRRWPQENYAELIFSLHNRFEIQTVLIGGRDDINYVEEFSKKLPNKIDIYNFCGKLSIKELVGLFSKSHLLITNDSGPLHIANIIDLPTVSFFGPETPRLYGPRGPKHKVLYDDTFCSPCINIYNSKKSDCSDNICLKKINPQTVIQVIETNKFLQ